MKEGKTEYLQMIQETIGRMSTNSALFKGFAATIVAGISMLSFGQLNTWIMLLSFVPVVSFFVLDVYYFTLERKFRYLYDQVREERHEIDFSMELTKKSIEIIEAKARVWDCVRSPSIFFFYPVMLCVLLIVCILRLRGVV